MIQLTWPHEKTDWEPYLEAITSTYVAMTDAISRHEPVLIVSPHTDDVRHLLSEKLCEQQLRNVHFHACDTNDTWARDHAFLSLVSEDDVLLTDFRFNGWGEKFPAEKDNAINRSLWKSRIFNRLYASVAYEDHDDFVLEGGSIESDGCGTLFTTTCCLTASHRNQPLQKVEIERELKRRLRAMNVVWLDCKPMPGDDTDGHIDTMVRLAPDDTILYNSDCGAREQLEALKSADGKPYRLIELPVPAPIFDDDGEQLPATYANFLVINGAVLVPTYGQPERDDLAASLISKAFPEREIVRIDSRTIIRQHGSIHCCTMQYPRITLKD